MLNQTRIVDGPDEISLDAARTAARAALDTTLAQPGRRQGKGFYADLVAIAASRVGVNDAEDAVGNALVGLYGRIQNAFESQDISVLVDAQSEYASPHYVIRCVANAAIDMGRKVSRLKPNESLTHDSVPVIGVRVDGISPDDEDLSSFADPAEVVTRDIVTDPVYVEVSALVKALNARQRSHPGSRLILSDSETEHLRLMYRFDPSLSPEQTKAKNDGRAARDRSGDQRRRNEGKTVPGFDPNYGMTTRLAAYLGIDKSTVTKRNRKLLKRLSMAVYLTAVLGRRDSMTSKPVTDEHLDLFERWMEEPSRIVDMNAYTLASRSVRTAHGPGSRVHPRIYVDKLRHAGGTLPNEDDHVGLNRVIGALHDSETRYTYAVGSRFPRCVLLCDWHEVSPDRVAG